MQKVRANSPHSTLDSLVARFRQLRPDLVRIFCVSVEGCVPELPNQVPQHTAPQAKNAKLGSTSLHKRFHKVCPLLPFTTLSVQRLRFGKIVWTCADQLWRLEQGMREVSLGAVQANYYTGHTVKTKFDSSLNLKEACRLQG